ncbi:MAG: hypothetical protein AB7E55_00950 [Pigmentiphaga sp.]
MANDRELKIVISAYSKGAEEGIGKLSNALKSTDGEQRKLNESLTDGSSVSTRLATAVGKLAASYIGYQAATKIIGGIVTATREAESAQFALQASVEAASREFEATGGINDWSAKVKELSADLRIYSETDVANATARTIDMTKRLGLTAEQMEEVIRRTADLSAGKTDLEGGIERVTAALRGEAEALEFLGLTLNETYVKSWYEANAATEKAWKDLNDIEKAQMRYNVLLEQTAATQGRAADSVRTFDGALEMVRAQVANAITNNEEMGDAMQRLALLISDNADEIAGFAAALTSAIGDIVKFTLENKELLLTLAGSGGLVMALGKTAGAVSGVAGALKSLGGVKVPDILSADGKINAALLARAGLYGALAVSIGLTVKAYLDMREAQDEAAAAEKRAAESAARAQAIADRAAKQTGLQIKDIYHLNQLLREGVVLRDRETDSYLTQEQAAAKLAAAKQQEAEARVKAWKAENELQKAIAAGSVVLDERTGKYISAAEAMALVQEKEETLTDALERAKTAGVVAAESVDKLGDAYFDAAQALAQLTAGKEGYEDALKAKLNAEMAYVDAVEQLRDQTLGNMEDRNNEELRALKQKHELQLLAEQERLENGLITQAEYNHLKLQAEEKLAQAVLNMRGELTEKSAELYGKDSDEYRAAAADKIDAEIELKKAQQETRAAWEETIGTGAAARKSAGDFAESLREVGRAGQEGGRMAAGGMIELTGQTERAIEMTRKLTEEQKKLATADFFGGQYTAIQKAIGALSSLEEATTWANQVVTSKNGRTYTNKDLMSMGGAGIAGQSAFTRSANKYAEQLYLQKLNELSGQGAPQLAAQQQVKTMTVNLKSGSQTVAATVPEADAGRLLEVFRRAGMVTV